MEAVEWFATRILPHEPALRAWLQSRRTPGLEVSDVIQETYALLAARSDLETIDNPRAYLFRTAWRVLLGHVRRSKIVSILVTDDLEQWQHAIDAPSIEQGLMDKQELHELMQWIDAMPPQTRRVFILRRIEALSQADVARRLGISPRTVEKHMARAIAFLISRYSHGADGRVQSSLQRGAAASPSRRGLLRLVRGSRD